MMLYLVRHAHAVEAAENRLRPLSARGRDQVRALSAVLRASAVLQTAEVWHSGLARALETARLLVAGLQLDARLVEIDGLRGGDDPAVAAGHLRHRRSPLMIVGHEPHLSALASLLVAGRAEPPIVVLKKSAVLALERIGGHWTVRWQISPELLASDDGG